MSLAGFTFASRLRSFVFAARGLRHLLSTQHNAWLHAAATVCVIGAAVFYEVSRWDWLFLIFAMVAVWTSEAMNTALELVCDAVSPGFHPLIEKAKDVAAGAVLVCAAGALAVGVAVFHPYVTQRLPATSQPPLTGSP